MSVDLYCYEAEFLPPASDIESDPYLLVSIGLFWTATDPHVVSATFRVGLQERRGWILGRDLLGDGLLYPVGLGDVFLSPDPFDPWSVVLVLESNSGRAGFRMPAEFVSDFLVEVDEAEHASDRGLIR